MKVAVVGAGLHGVVAIKISKEYGFDVHCFEKTADIGGIWRYNPQPGRTSVMKSTITNISKEMMSFSDYPPAVETTNFVHHSTFLKYIHDYADHFGVRKFIRFYTEVLKIEKSANFEQTGQWMITCRDLRNGEDQSQIFDAVMVSTGRQAEPYWPLINGSQKFDGRLMHAQDYKEDTGFEDHRVLIIGSGNSACDIACELSSKCSQVYMSVGNGVWIVGRTLFFGYPADLILLNRFMKWLANLCPSFTNSIAEFLMDLRFKHSLYGLKTKRRIFNTIPTINDELQAKILSGQIKIKPAVSDLSKNNMAEFKDGTVERNIDDVIMCTGYINAFPFIEADILDVKGRNDLNLYKFMYPPRLGNHSTLCFIGILQPPCPVSQLSELQVRLHCEVLLKRVKLPNATEMIRLTDEQNDSIRRRYGRTTPHFSSPVDGQYADDLAKLFGAKPSIWRTLLSGDLQLAVCLTFGPLTSYQYRLQGPHAWVGARNAVVNAWDRALAPFESNEDRKITKRRYSTWQRIRSFLFIVLGCAIVFVLALLYS